MINRRFQYRSGGFNPFNFIIGALILFLVFWLITRLVQFIWWLALIAMPVLLIATFILNRQVIFNYTRGIARTFKRSTGLGVVATLLSVVGLPFVTLFLFGQAMFLRRFQQAQQAAEEANQVRYGEYIQYEEVDSITLLDDHREPQPRQRPEDESEDDPYASLWK